MSFQSTSMSNLRFRAFLLLRGIRDAIRGTPINAATFTGSIFDRVEGIDYLLDRCRGASILDIGACDGLVAYEFAKCGADLIHGFDCNISDVAFAMRLFRSVPVESAFIHANVALGPERFIENHESVLRDSYDIVLFLGVYHHLKRQMKPDRLSALLDCLLRKSKRCFAIRTNLVAECESQILSSGFKLVHETEECSKAGKLQVYQRDNETNAT